MRATLNKEQLEWVIEWMDNDKADMTKMLSSLSFCHKMQLLLTEDNFIENLMLILYSSTTFYFVF